MKPDEVLGLAHALAAAPDAGEPAWRAAAALAQRAVHLLVAAHLGLDPAGFAGTPRTLAEALAAVDPSHAPDFIRIARRHFITGWIAGERALGRPGEPFGARDARLSLAYADAVFGARAAAN